MAESTQLSSTLSVYVSVNMTEAISSQTVCEPCERACCLSHSRLLSVTRDMGLYMVGAVRDGVLYSVISRGKSLDYTIPSQDHLRVSVDLTPTGLTKALALQENERV